MIDEARCLLEVESGNRYPLRQKIRLRNVLIAVLSLESAPLYYSIQSHSISKAVFLQVVQALQQMR